MIHLSNPTSRTHTLSNRRDILLFCTGGAWITGSNDENGRYDGADLASQYGVVVIAANYRLDALGWMALDELAAETDDGGLGNYGLKDQGTSIMMT